MLGPKTKNAFRFPGNVFPRISPEEILDKVANPSSGNGVKRNRCRLGTKYAWVIAHAAGKGYLALLNTLAKYFENVPLDKLLPLLQKTIQSCPDAGLNMIGIIAKGGVCGSCV